MLTNAEVPMDNQWHRLNIPLKNFIEHGAWENDIQTCFNPIGKFDWSTIDLFEIVAEHQSLANTKLWFDKIELVHPDLVNVNFNKTVANTFELKQNYPNPFNPTTIIGYTIPGKVGTENIQSLLQTVQLSVYDILGKEVAILVNEKKSSGNYQVIFNASNLSSGVYFYTLRTGKFILTKKMILQQ